MGSNNSKPRYVGGFHPRLPPEINYNILSRLEAQDVDSATLTNKESRAYASASNPLTKALVTRDADVALEAIKNYGDLLNDDSVSTESYNAMAADAVRYATRLNVPLEIMEGLLECFYRFPYEDKITLWRHVADNYKRINEVDPDDFEFMNLSTINDYDARGYLLTPEEKRARALARKNVV